MKALLAALALTALAAAPATAAIHKFQTALDGASEVPANASSGTGFATVTFDTLLHTMRYEVSFADLTGTTTASHVHAPTAVAGTGTIGVATELPSFTGFPLGVTFGSYDHTFDTSLTATWNPNFLTNFGGGTALGAESAFIDALFDGKGYLNIHTTFAPGGEIRGFFASVPEPGTWALMIAGFGGVGAMLRRRRLGQPAVA